MELEFYRAKMERWQNNGQSRVVIVVFLGRSNNDNDYNNDNH